MKGIVFTSAVLVLIAMTSINQPHEDDAAATLTQMIDDLKQLRDKAPLQEKVAFEATIESLTRLRDHGTWPVVNSPVAISSLQNTKWLLPQDKNGFQQSIRFSSSAGQWLTKPESKPFSFNWQVESDRIRLSHHSSYQDPFNYQIVDQTYQYTLAGDQLIMKRGDSTLVWQRAPNGQ